jgi:hypothetical protein
VYIEVWSNPMKGFDLEGVGVWATGSSEGKACAIPPTPGVFL